MLNVQQVRLRFIFVRALYPVSLFSKGLRKGVSTASPIFKRLTAKIFQNGQGGGRDSPPRTAVVPRSSEFSSEKLDVEQCTRKYTVQQAIFKSAGDVGIRTADQKYI